MSGLSSVIGVDEAASHAQTIFFLFQKTFFFFFLIYFDPNLKEKKKRSHWCTERERLNPHRPSGLIGPERIAKLGLNIKEDEGKKVRV